MKNQIQATLDKNTSVQTENYNWHAEYWQNGKKFTETTWRKESKLGLFVNEVYCLKEGISRVPTKKLLEMTHTEEKYPPWELLQEAPTIKSNLVPMGISGYILVNLF